MSARMGKEGEDSVSVKIDEFGEMLTDGRG